MKDFTYNLRFEEAIEALKAGKAVRSKSMRDGQYFIYNLDRSKGPYGVCSSDGGNAYMQDYNFEHKDWKVVTK